MNPWKGKKVLVTGATSFLGSWLSKELLQKGSRVTGFSRKPDQRLFEFHRIQNKVELLLGDIASESDVQKAFQQAAPDYCFHLAAISSPTVCNENPLQAFRVNVVGSSVVLNACAEHQAKTILASSVRIYGERPTVSENSPVETKKAYPFSKVVSENMLRFLVLQRKLDAVIARLSTVYGPIRFPASDHFVNNNIVDALNGRSTKNKKDYVRDFLFVSDAVNGLLLLAEQCTRFSGKAFNLSSGKTFLGTDLAQNIRELVKGKSAFFKPLPGHCIQNRLAFSKLGWKPIHGIEKGLRETIEWYQKTPEAF
jgi:CDP-glucose 4,6-dehydratase